MTFESLKTAEAAIQLADLMEEEHRLKDDEAYYYAELACQTYEKVYSQVHIITLEAMWQKLSISYAQRKEDTKKQCNDLLLALNKRDYLTESNEPYELSKPMDGEKEVHRLRVKELRDAANQKTHETESILRTIKLSVIATTIMEKTRNLSEKPMAKIRPDKRLVRDFCDKLLFTAKINQTQKGREGVIPSLIEYHVKKHDPKAIDSVKNIVVNFTPKDQEGLL